MMKFSLLGSGSEGNATFVEADNYRFLIDAGFSGKETGKRLDSIGIEMDTIQSILVTHEHGDHIKGAGILSRKYNIPIYMTKKSYIKGASKIGKVDEKNLRFIDGDFTLGSGIEVSPFEVMHDAAMTIGFSIKDREKKQLSVATDIGYISNVVRDKFMHSDAIIIESNYDYNMLMNGPYPWELKNRVKGRNGHLSNDDAGKFLCDIYHKELQKAYLVHISKDNNRYDLVEKFAKNILRENSMEFGIEVARQHSVTNMFEIV